MGALLDRFGGTDNRRRLLAAILDQALVAHDDFLADRLIEVGELRELAAGDKIITQGDWDDDVFFILAGSFEVIINGQSLAVREAGTHVGELTGTSPARARTATVASVKDSLVLRLRYKDLEAIAGENPAFLKRMLNVLAERLDERNRKIGQTNEIPRVFVISSSEQRRVVEEIVTCLDGNEIAVDTWDKGTFGISDYPISSLMDAIERADFTISVVAADDILVMRGQIHQVARDNVHMEYGLSLGALGRLRSILLVCADDEVKLPSDTAGLTTLRYRDGSMDEFRRSIRNACIQVKKHILDRGVMTDRIIR